MANKKKKQPRCSICSKFFDIDLVEMGSVYTYIRFEDVKNINEYVQTYIHRECFFNLPFSERQLIVGNAIDHGTLPMDSMYAVMKDKYQQLSRHFNECTKDLSLSKNRIKKLEFLTRWHKYPDELPDISLGDTFWVTTIKDTCVQRDVFIDGKWEYYEDVIAWAFLLYPSRFNEVCYPDILNLYPNIGE